jgi:hypothetical protein
VVSVFGFLLPNDAASSSVGDHRDQVSASSSSSPSVYSLRSCFHANACDTPRLTVGWTWEVVVASFLKLVTESIELTAAQEVGVRLAIVVIILISSAAVFYWFKDGEALYLIDPFADPEVTTAETELRPGGNNNNNTPDNNDVAVNPMASRSTMNR